jgi:hypothetical protein
MPYLGDYLGQLLSEIAIARMQADLETVRLAELYAAHPLLRTLPVPHLRLPEVALEIPVLIEASEEPRPGESARGGATLADMRLRFDEVLTTRLSKSGIPLTAADRKRVGAAIAERVELLGGPTETAIDVHRIADDLTSTALRVIGETRGGAELAKPATAERFAAELNETVRLEFLKLRTPPPRLLALVTSAEIRAVDAPESVTRLRVTLTEQGVEWTTIESDGVSRDRLVPE